MSLKVSVKAHCVDGNNSLIIISIQAGCSVHMITDETVADFYFWYPTNVKRFRFWDTKDIISLTQFEVNCDGSCGVCSLFLVV